MTEKPKMSVAGKCYVLLRNDGLMLNHFHLLPFSVFSGKCTLLTVHETLNNKVLYLLFGQLSVVSWICL